MLEELVSAILRGDIEAAVARLGPDVVLVADCGPNRKAARRPIVGADKVVRLLRNGSNIAQGSSAPPSVGSLPTDSNGL